MADRSSAYEQDIARRIGLDEAVAFGFARHALIAMLTASGLRAGDEVVLSPLTCKVMPLALLSMGLKPVYADISATTLNLDAERAGAAIGPATRAVLFQHTYGHSGGVGDVAETAQRNGLPMIEDCAQCLPLAEASYTPGHFGRGAIFSNNLGKPLPAGSGGVAVTRDAALAAKVREIRDALPRRTRIGELVLAAEEWLHGYVLRPSLYWPLFDLYRRTSANYGSRALAAEIASQITRTAVRPSARQLRLGAEWMARLERVARHRRACCAAYDAALKGVDHLATVFDSGTEPLYYYPVLVADKAWLLQQARRRRIEIIPWPMTTPIYPVEERSALSTYGYEPGSCPVAESVAGRLVALPTHERITPQVRDRTLAFLADRRNTGA